MTSTSLERRAARRRGRPRLHDRKFGVKLMMSEDRYRRLYAIAEARGVSIGAVVNSILFEVLEDDDAE